MKAIILAAGCGNRLRPLTDTVPKALVTVGNEPIIGNTIRCLRSAGIKDIGIVVGYKGECIKKYVSDTFDDLNICFFENNRYKETNNIVSLYSAIDYCDDDMILLECDVMFSMSALSRLIDGEGDCDILVSDYDPLLMNGTVIRTHNGCVSELVLGEWQDSEFDFTSAYKTVNLYKFSKTFLNRFVTLISWYVKKISEKVYYEKVLGMLIYSQEYDVRTIIVPSSMWCEIDDVNDLKRAREMCEGLKRK